MIKHKIFFILLILIALGIWGLRSVYSPDVPKPKKTSANYAPGEVLVKFKADTAKRFIVALKEKLKVKNETFTKSISLYHWKGDFNTERALKLLKRSRHVLYAEPNYIVKIEK